MTEQKRIMGIHWVFFAWCESVGSTISSLLSFFPSSPRRSGALEALEESQDAGSQFCSVGERSRTRKTLCGSKKESHGTDVAPALQLQPLSCARCRGNIQANARYFACMLNMEGFSFLPQPASPSDSHEHSLRLFTRSSATQMRFLLS